MPSLLSCSSPPTLYCLLLSTPLLNPSLSVIFYVAFLINFSLFPINNGDEFISDFTAIFSCHDHISLPLNFLPWSFCSLSHSPRTTHFRKANKSAAEFSWGNTRRSAVEVPIGEPLPPLEVSTTTSSLVL
ncbi:hypothetical protein V6N13_051215 [Hibiscus sabdariffa]|uniref:Uncharacterized protein n=1 Tax=Hibiscus sabdariffa TaxID=183260 RepID=A0ABR2T2Z4_9ROSI